MRMPKLPVLKPREVISILKRLGFFEIRQKGSHLQMKKGNLLVTVPIHAVDVSQETLKSILRQAKMSVEEFTAFL